jgi:hypothetical protein
MNINQMSAGSGRKIKEDNTIVNLADKIDEIHKALVVDKSAGIQLTGRITKETLTRAVRVAGNYSADIPVPTYAKGALVQLRIHGITGTFAADEGYNLRVNTYLKSVYTPDGELISTLAKSNISFRNQMVVIYPGVNYVTDNYDPANQDRKLINGPIVGDILRCRVDINGTFATGQGVDCDIHVQWLI